MILIGDRALSPEGAAALLDYQGQVDSAASYPEKVDRAKRQFSQRNKKGNAVFDEIKAVLDEMCTGARRCMYCEDSVADEVEHFRPKDLYPELAFAWANYLYACGPCNGPKNNKFQVFDAAGAAVDVARKRGQPVVPPPAGDAVLIDPRREDPTVLLFLDVRDTFQYRPALGLDPRGAIRAAYTVTTLGLNREFLRRGRRGAFKHYLALLEKYVRLRAEGAAAAALLDCERGIRRETGHPTVWAELKRQRESLGPQVAELFVSAPEALTW